MYNEINIKSQVYTYDTSKKNNLFFEKIARMNYMKDCNAIQYRYYLVLITFERDFKGD